MNFSKLAHQIHFKGTFENGFKYSLVGGILFFFTHLNKQSLIRFF